MNAITRDFPMMFEPSPDTTRALRDAFGKFATGVAVITCDSGHGPVAITVNSFSSISLEPALIMWAASTSSKRYPAFEAAKHYAVHILSSEQQGLCEEFSKNGFGLKDMAHTLNAEGVPVFDGCLARFECRRWDIHPAGDHAIMLGEVLRAGVRSGDALTFFSGKFAQLAQP